MGDLGFSLEREWRLNPPPESEGFANKAFVFSRADMRGNASGDVEDRTS
jgi:hypothetical protein